MFLGMPLLRILGFDLDEHLSKVQNFLKNLDVSKLAPKSTSAPRKLPLKEKKIGSMLNYTELWYKRTKDDPINQPESVVSSMAVDNESYIKDAFIKITYKVPKNWI